MYEIYVFLRIFFFHVFKDIIFLNKVGDEYVVIYKCQCAPLRCGLRHPRAAGPPLGPTGAAAPVPHAATHTVLQQAGSASILSMGSNHFMFSFDFIEINVSFL